MPMHIYNNKMKGTVMGRAIDMEKDINVLNLKVKKLEDTVRGMVSKLDSLDEKSSKTIKVDLVEDVGTEVEGNNGENNEKEKTNNEGNAKSSKQSNNRGKKQRSKNK